MNILVDENIPTQTVLALREAGHAVIDVRGTPQMGVPDEELWRRAQQDKALLITTDKAFVRRSQESHHGVLAICLRKPNRTKIHARVMQAMARFKETQWPGSTVTMRDRIQSVRRSKLKN